MRCTISVDMALGRWYLVKWHHIASTWHVFQNTWCPMIGSSQSQSFTWNAWYSDKWPSYSWGLFQKLMTINDLWLQEFAIASGENMCHQFVYQKHHHFILCTKLRQAPFLIFAFDGLHVFLKYHLERSTGVIKPNHGPIANCHPFWEWLVISVSIWRSKVAPCIEDISLISPLGITASENRLVKKNQPTLRRRGLGLQFLAPGDTQGTKSIDTKTPYNPCCRLTSHQLHERRPKLEISIFNNLKRERWLSNRIWRLQVFLRIAEINFSNHVPSTRLSKGIGEKMVAQIHPH